MLNEDAQIIKYKDRFFLMENKQFLDIYGGAIRKAKEEISQETNIINKEMKFNCEACKFYIKDKKEIDTIASTLDYSRDLRLGTARKFYDKLNDKKINLFSKKVFERVRSYFACVYSDPDIKIVATKNLGLAKECLVLSLAVKNIVEKGNINDCEITSVSKSKNKKNDTLNYQLQLRKNVDQDPQGLEILLDIKKDDKIKFECNGKLF